MNASETCASSGMPLGHPWTTLPQVTVFFLTSVWILRKSAFVEGILDGSKLSDGKVVPVRTEHFRDATSGKMGNPPYILVHEIVWQHPRPPMGRSLPCTVTKFLKSR